MERELNSLRTVVRQHEVKQQVETQR
jgi:hypothetical protein